MPFSGAPAGSMPDIRLITGPILVGNILGWGLYGALLVQLYLYHVTFHNDRKLIRISVYGLMLLDTLQTFATTDLAWRLMASGWGNQLALIDSSWDIAAVPLLSGMVSTWVQLFFAWRIFVLGNGSWGWRVVAGAISVSAVSVGGCGVGVAFRFQFSQNTLQFGVVYPQVIAWLLGSAIVDLTIAIAMVYFFTSARKVMMPSGSGNETLGGAGDGQQLLTRLTRMSIQTGAITASAAIIDLALEIGFRGTNVHLAACILMTKLYTNTFMASLNARAPPLPPTGNALGHSCGSMRMRVSGRAIVLTRPTFDVGATSDGVTASVGSYARDAQENLFSKDQAKRDETEPRASTSTLDAAV